jgi:hypothetical protein
MIDHDWLVGFFFIATDDFKAPELYFVCLQNGCTAEQASQIVIAGTSNQGARFPKVAYIVSPSSLESTNEASLERLCRIAVAQFLSKLPMDNFLAQVLSLDLAVTPWCGEILPLTTADVSFA